MDVQRRRATGIIFDLNSKYQTLNVSWEGEADLELIESGCRRIAEIVEEHPVQYICNDNRNLYGNWPDLDEGLVQNWVQELAENGVQKIAHILSPDPINRKGAYQYLPSNLPYQLQYMKFETLLSATKWMFEEDIEVQEQKVIL